LTAVFHHQSLRTQDATHGVQPNAGSCLRVVFAVTEVGADAAAGDVFTAMELGAALAQQFGWQVSYRPQGTGWYALSDVDVVVAMVDDFNPRCITGGSGTLIKVAWARNWFERWCNRDGFGQFDVYLASSLLGASYLGSRLGKLVRVLRIATNTQRFTAEDRAQSLLFDYVFTGSYWDADRDIVQALSGIPPALRGAVYGKNWHQVPALGALNQGFVRYQDLPGVYRQAAVVIDDANHVTKAWGAANSRVFDALAAGCLVITNSESVSHEVFAGELPVYRSPAELGQLLSDFLQNPTATAQLQQRLRVQVVQQHNYTLRAHEFRSHIARYQGTRGGT